MNNSDIGTRGIGENSPRCPTGKVPETRNGLVINKQQEARGNATAKTGDPGSGDRTEMISPMKPRIKGPKDKSALTLKDPLMMDEIKVQTRMENGQQQGGHPIVKPGESRNTERAMATKDPPLSRHRYPRISAKANKQDCHSDSKYIKQGKAEKQEGHTNTKPIKQDKSKKAGHQRTARDISVMGRG